MRKASLQFRMLIAVVTLIASVTLVLDLVVVHVTKQFMHTRFADRITFLAKYLALNSEVGVLINDETGLKTLARNLLGEEDVARVIIMDNHNHHLVDLNRNVGGNLSVVETPILFKKASDENIVFNGENAVARNPFDKADLTIEETIGKVQIHYTTRGIDQLYVRISRRFLIISVVLALLGGFVFYMIYRPIGREMTQLAATATLIGSGDLELRAALGNLPETRSVAISFNTMLDSLENGRKAYERVSREMFRQKALAEVGKFSLMVAHEVKNPLGIIKGALDILKKDLPDASSNTMVAYIEDEIIRLNHLIEEFLLFARPAKPSMCLVNLNDLLLEVAQRVQIQYVDADMTFNLEVPSYPCETNADKDLITRGIGNIINNACEAVNHNGCITVSAQERDGWWIATVEDNGDGIPPENLHRIFEPFFTTRSKGTGLGLAFASQVVKAHGGMLSAENREAGGAIFVVKLPVGMSTQNAWG